MIRPSIIGAAVAALFTAQASADESLLKCQVMAGVDFTDDGTLEPVKVGALWQLGNWISGSGEFVVDLDTGALHSTKGSEVAIWKIIKPGDSVNDAVLIPPNVDRPADFVEDFLRIRNWSGDYAADGRRRNPIRFFWIGLTTVVTGTCVPVG